MRIIIALLTLMLFACETNEIQPTAGEISDPPNSESCECWLDNCTCWVHINILEANVPVGIHRWCNPQHSSSSNCVYFNGLGHHSYELSANQGPFATGTQPFWEYFLNTGVVLGGGEYAKFEVWGCGIPYQIMELGDPSLASGGYSYDFYSWDYCYGY